MKPPSIGSRASEPYSSYSGPLRFPDDTRNPDQILYPNLRNLIISPSLLRKPSATEQKLRPNFSLTFIFGSHN